MQRLRQLFCRTTLFLAPALSFGGVITFGSLGNASVPANYGGFNWPSGVSWNVTSNATFDSAYNDTYGAPSGGGAWAGADGCCGYLTNNSPFTFLGADFASWAIGNSVAGLSATSIMVAGYDAENNLVGTASMSLSPTGYNFLSADIPNITKLVFTGTGGLNYSDWLMDDITYSTANSATTPEPNSVILLAIAFALTRFVSRKNTVSQDVPDARFDLRHP